VTCQMLGNKKLVKQYICLPTWCKQTVEGSTDSWSYDIR